MEPSLQQSVRDLADACRSREVLDEEIAVMREATNHIPDLPLPVFPAGVETRWETASRVIWNERKRIAEEQELIYEVAWIPELGMWRRFLRSRRKAHSFGAAEDTA